MKIPEKPFFKIAETRNPLQISRKLHIVKIGIIAKTSNYLSRSGVGYEIIALRPFGFV